MNKNQIIQTYQQARTIKKIEEAKNELSGKAGQLLSWELMQIKAVYKKRMEELKWS